MNETTDITRARRETLGHLIEAFGVLELALDRLVRSVAHRLADVDRSELLHGLLARGRTATALVEILESCLRDGTIGDAEAFVQGAIRPVRSLLIRRNYYVQDLWRLDGSVGPLIEAVRSSTADPNQAVAVLLDQMWQGRQGFDLVDMMDLLARVWATTDELWRAAAEIGSAEIP